MKILIVNDDGYQATGLRILIEKAVQFGEVVVYSPFKCESAQSQKITIHKSIKVDKVCVSGVLVNAVHGSTADCVRLGVFDHPDIDLVLSGVNEGLNMGQDIFYSSTIAGVMQAGMFGYRGVALSYDKNYIALEKQLPGVLNEVVLNNSKYNDLINVNLPSAKYDMYKGFKMTIGGNREFENKFTIDKDNNYLETNVMIDDFTDGTDSGEVSKGYVSITNLSLKRTFK